MVKHAYFNTTDFAACTRILQILQILQILERAPEIPGYLGGLRDHVRSGIPVPILAGATAATCVLETSCNILPYVRLNSPYQHTSSYASTRYLLVPAYAYLAQQQDLPAYPEDGNRYPDTFIPHAYPTSPCPLRCELHTSKQTRGTSLSVRVRSH